MTKAELIDKIASGAGLSKVDAGKALDTTLNSHKGCPKKRSKGHSCWVWYFLGHKKEIQKRP